MNKELRAVVLMFEGYEPTSLLLSDLGTILGTQCGAEKISASVYNKTDLADSAVKTAVLHVITKPGKNTPSEEDYNAEEKAVIYIGTLFKNVLGQSYKTETFVSALTQKISEARYASDEDSKAFMNALFVLSQEDLHISQALLRKYRMNESKILIIKRIYNIVTSVR